MSMESDLARRVRELEAEVARLGEMALPLRAVVEDMSELVVRWKPDGTRLFVNDAYCRLFGLRRAETIGTSFWPLISEADRAEVHARIAALTRGEPVSAGRHRAHGPDGATVWMEWVDRAIYDDAGTLIELQSVGRDVTERVRLEEQVRRVEAADAAARAAAGIAHDLKNVFQVIQVVAGLLVEAPDPGDLASLRDAVKAGLALINRLNHLSHGVAQTQRALDLNGSVAGLQGLLRELAKPSVALVQRLHPRPLPILADPTQIDQVLLNLVRNSVDALQPKGGQVTIETDQLAYGALPPDLRPDADPCVLLRVTDDGPGISNEILPRVFDARITTKPQGQGLGLATVKAIVEGHRGKVRVSSSERGTTFELAFPSML